MESNKDQNVHSSSGILNITKANIDLIHELLSTEYKECNENIPDCLYQYRPVNSNTLDQINKKYIWCSSPSTFNDIYDSSGIYKFIDAVYQKTNDTTMKKVDKDPILNAFINKLRISSFTSTALNQTMWSHYANRYTGICIKYNISSIQNNIYKVSYSLKMQDIDKIGMKLLKKIKQKQNPMAYDVNILLTLLGALFKNDSWHYEKEYRFVSFSPLLKDNRIPLTPQKIIFGPKADEREIDIIKNLVRDDVEFSKIVLDKDNIAFEMTPI